LPESACAAVTVGTQGKILAKHLTVPFLSELDGYSVSNFPAPEMRSGRVYESPGGQLWTLVPEGLEEFKDGAWMLHPLPEIAAARRICAVGAIVSSAARVGNGFAAGSISRV
jgi:hypothetical protein